MDDDLTHAAIARFEAIEARLDALEEGATEPTIVEDENEEEEVPSFLSEGSE